jgi:hypothetical protein
MPPYKVVRDTERRERENSELTLGNLMLTTQSHTCWAEYSIQEAQRREESGRGKHEAPGERGFKV